MNSLKMLMNSVETLAIKEKFRKGEEAKAAAADEAVADESLRKQ